MHSSIMKLTRHVNFLDKLTNTPWKSFIAIRRYNRPLELHNRDEFSAMLESIPPTSFQYPEQKIHVPKENERPIDILGKEIRHCIDYLKTSGEDETLVRYDLPRQYDIIVIGGGFIGTSIGYWLREKHRSVQSILVIDKNLKVDTAYGCEKPEQVPAAASRGNFRLQFPSSYEIQLATFAAEFYRNINEYLDMVDEPPINLPYKPFGYLTLSNEKTEDVLKDNHVAQAQCGVNNELLTSFQMTQRFPWLNTNDITLGNHGLQDEGWVDPQLYLLAMRSRAMKYGTLFVEAEPLEFIYNKEPIPGIKGFDFEQYRPTNHLTIKLSDGKLKTISFGTCILALGPETGKFSKELLHLDRNNPGLFGLEIPIHPRKRYVFAFEAPDGGPELSSPLITDLTGLFIKRTGVTEYICGMAPIPEEEPDPSNLDVDYDFFYKRVWPFLAHRIPLFERLKLTAGWAYLIDHNTFDGQPIVGRHPTYHNVFVAAGFGEHEFQFSPGIGRAFCELMFDGYYSTANLDDLSFKRILRDFVSVEEERINN